MHGTHAAAVAAAYAAMGIPRILHIFFGDHGIHLRRHARLAQLFERSNFGITLGDHELRVAAAMAMAAVAVAIAATATATVAASVTSATAAAAAMAAVAALVAAAAAVFFLSGFLPHFLHPGIAFGDHELWWQQL